MIERLIATYKKGAMTADHVAVESLHMLDPERPELVLAALPSEVLTCRQRYVNAYQPRRMRANYGIPPAVNQVEAARQWLKAKVEK